MIKRVLHTLFPDKNLSKFPTTSLNKKLSLLDVGARDGIGYPWNTAKSGNLNVILVEPDPQEAELLRKHHQGEILPYALWSKETELVLNINNSVHSKSHPLPHTQTQPTMPIIKVFSSNEIMINQ